MATSKINVVFSYVFFILALGVGALGLTVLAGVPQSLTEWGIVALCFLAAFFLFLGGRQTREMADNQLRAEEEEDVRLQKLNLVQPPKMGSQLGAWDVLAKIETERQTDDTAVPLILAHWYFSKSEWKWVAQKVKRKSYREEMYTAVWFPIMFGVLAWERFWWGFLAGVITGILYLLFRAYFVAQKLALKQGQMQAEIIISDSYLRINGKYIHYADGKYFVQNIIRESDERAGELLHFDIGWQTNKGYAASMDLYVPIPRNSVLEADEIVAHFKKLDKK